MILTVQRKQLFSKTLTAGIKNLETAYMDSEGWEHENPSIPKEYDL